MGIMAILSLVIAFALFVYATNRLRREQEAARAEMRRTDYSAMRLLALAGILVIAGIMMGAGALGQYEENQIQVACQKHGMDGFRVGFGRSGCIDSDGHVRYFKDVR